MCQDGWPACEEGGCDSFAEDVQNCSGSLCGLISEEGCPCLDGEDHWPAPSGMEKFWVCWLLGFACVLERCSFALAGWMNQRKYQGGVLPVGVVQVEIVEAGVGGYLGPGFPTNSGWCPFQKDPSFPQNPNLLLHFDSRRAQSNFTYETIADAFFRLQKVANKIFQPTSLSPRPKSV